MKRRTERRTGRAAFIGLFGLLALAVQAVRAGEPPVALTLEAAVRAARQSSPALAGAAAGAEAARAGASGARAMRWPRLEGRETAIRTNGPADVFGLELTQERFSFPAFTQNDPNDPDPLTHWSSELEVAMPLFTGGKLSAGIAQAEAMARAARDGRAHAERSIDLAVSEGYLGLLLAREAVGLADKAVATTQKHVEQAQSYFDAGMLVESDLLSAKVQLARMRDARIESRSRVAVALAGLSRAIGRSLSDSLVLQEPAPVTDSLPSSYVDARQIARTHRADLAASNAQVQAAHAAVKGARAGYLPSLGVSGRWTLGDDRPFGSHGSSYTVAAQAKWTIWDWGMTHADVTRQRAQETVARSASEAADQAIDFEIRAAWERLVSARARRATADEAVSAAERGLAILDDRFQAGATRVTDLLDMETSLYESRVRALEARFAEQSAARGLLFSAGLPPVPEVH